MMIGRSIASILCAGLVAATPAAGADESYLDVSALDSACVAAIRLSEQQLVEGPEAWPQRTPIRFAPLALVTAALAVHGQGNIADADCYVVATCAMADNLRVHIVVVALDGKDINRAVYLVTERDAAVVSSARYAWLTTSCRETLLGLPAITDDGRLQVRAIRHTFDCGTDAFLATEQQEGKLLTLMLDGNLRQMANSHE